MRRIVFFLALSCALCLPASAQDNSATAANTNLTNVNAYTGVGGISTINNNPTNTNLSASGAEATGGNASNSGSFQNNVKNDVGLEFSPVFEAQEQRTMIPGLPLVYPAFPRSDAQGPIIYGPVPNGGVEVFKWGKTADGKLENGDYYIQNAKRVLGRGGVVTLAGNIGKALFDGKAGYAAKGFNLSNFTRNVGKRVDNQPLIVINASVYSRDKLSDEALYKAGYFCVGTLPIDPPVQVNGAVVDDSVMKGVYCDLLKPTRVVIAQLYYVMQPVTETKTSYAGLGGATNDKSVGITVGVGQTNAQSLTNTKWPYLLRCWVYDPKAAAKHLAAPGIIDLLKNAQPGKPVTPVELLKVADNGTIYYREQQKTTAPTSGTPSAKPPAAMETSLKRPANEVDPIRQVVSTSPSLH